MNRLIQSLTDAAKHVKLPHRKPKEEVTTFYEDAPKPKKSKKGMKGASTEKASRAKKLVVVNLVGIGFLGGLFLYTHMDDRPDAKPNPQQTAAQSTKRTLPPLNLAAYANPFVDVQAVKKDGGTIPANGPLPQIPAMQQSQHITPSSSSSSIPAIRSTPLPNLPVIPQAQAPSNPSASPMPLPPNAPNAQTPKPSQQASVQGVVTGEDGENMAIMSDGTVVSEGETYQDGRIAYIGGDGITFDDGSSLKYGN